MAQTKYTYSISADFSGGNVNTGKLHKEIEASSISTTLLRIDTNGSILDIWFADSLSTGDKTTLDGDVTALAGGLLASGDSTPSAIGSTFLFAIDAVATTSTNFVVVPSMTTTLDAGTYIVTFSGSMQNDSRSKGVEVAIFADGARVSHSSRKFIRGNQQQTGPFTCIAKVTVNGSQAVEGRWKVDNNSSGIITERSLLLTPE